MATTQIGKLKLHASKRGIAWKWGDGEIHRFAFQRTPSADDGYQEADDSARYEDVSAYGGAYEAYDMPSGGYDDDGSLYVDGSDEIPEGIPDRYRFLYTNKWLMYLLLVLLPPLGIWILWKKGAFTKPIRTVITAISAIWFVLVLFWLFSGLFGRGQGGNDVVTQNPNVAETSVNYGTDATTDTTYDSTVADTTQIAPTPIPAQVSVQDTAADNTASADAATASTDDESDSSLVYASNTGMYYHASTDCPDIDEGAELVERSIARSRGQAPCPTCITAAASESSAASGTASTGTYYMTSGGRYYHTDPACSGMKNAQVVTLAAATKAGKKACPTCIGNYWATRRGKYYHTKEHCSGMTGAVRITREKAIAAGKKACPTCIGKTSSASSSSSSSSKSSSKSSKSTKSSKSSSKSTKSTSSSSSKIYYATRAGKYYHSKSNCQGMKNAVKISLATAKKYGKSACPVCIGSSKKTSSSSSSSTATSTKVYATSGGKYYHRKSSCSGMKNAKAMTLATAKAKGKIACPRCYPSTAAKTTYYYATASNKYYHTNRTCSGMKNAVKVTLATAKAKGKTACPVCVTKKAKASATTYCYASSSNKYYHKSSTCSGIKGLTRVTLAYAKSKGKTACPVCVTKTATPRPVKKVYCYASSGNRYYHKVKNCSGMTNAKKVLLSTAKAKGKTACPVCVLKTAQKISTNSADKKTICYASKSNAFFHASSSCVSGLKKTTVYKAKARGKTACPVCTGKTLTTYVYVSKDGLKYHRKSNCSGLTNPYKVSLDTALRYNFTRCTKCNAPKASG